MLPAQVLLTPFITMVARILALIIFVGAAITDLIDGKIARARNLVTNFGKLMDPLADKLLVASAFVAFVGLDLFPAWFVIIILFREFIVTGLRSLGTAQGRVIHADRWGKHKTVWQMATIITALVFLAVRDTLIWMGEWDRVVQGYYLEWWFQQVVITVLILICLFFTLLSGTLYVYRNWDLVRED
jgi:CDP-diacylglycerol--glycerol-3-phosphate 3-phosphatidyltransferase